MACYDSLSKHLRCQLTARPKHGYIGPMAVLYWQYSYAKFGPEQSCQYPMQGQYWSSITLILFAHGTCSGPILAKQYMARI